MEISKKVKSLIIHPIQPTISICFLIQCTYWKTFVIIYLTQRDLFFYFLSFKFDQFSILLMYQGENMERHFGQKLKFHVKRSRISYWTVEIFMLNGPDFHDKRLRFSCWTVEIFMTNGPDFHDERSWFSQWQVMTGRDFHNDRSKIALLLWLKSRSARGASGHSAFSFRPRISFIYLVDEFFFLLLK